MVLQVITDGSGVITTLTLSLVWIVYSIIPQYLLLHYTWVGRGTTLRYACQIGFILSTLCALFAIGLLWMVYPRTVRIPFFFANAGKLFAAKLIRYKKVLLAFAGVSVISGHKL